MFIKYYSEVLFIFRSFTKLMTVTSQGALMQYHKLNSQDLNRLTPPTQITKSDAWADTAMLAAYLGWRQEEQALLLKHIQPGDYVADYCCGDGRLIPAILGKASHFEGCDNDPEAIERARARAAAFDARVKLSHCDLMSFTPRNGSRLPDISTCLGNSLGALPYSLKDVLNFMVQHSEREVLASVLRKGTLEIRKEYYESLGIHYTCDEHSEIFHSPVWGYSRAYSRSELEIACRQVGFSSFEIEPVGELGFIVALTDHT